MYKPGTHIIATLKTSDRAKTNDYTGFQKLADKLITVFSLTKLGEVYHNFSPQGFTAVICLSESHISIHTWPEHDLVNLDIYLSNHERSNDETVSRIFNEVVSFYQATIESEQRIIR
ncbi:adenosylmethionine decarboxylase [Niabella beijingensis]|uniref:adenosylmethionine decarboxylase n=1 Tax=Niabella beijingensis TaxID=2872700 RepID=UPI001CBF6365|nr:adenosylmethionine decarboxylase [Niabella beijingensis]MBZ4187363.1 adenosylmethionine decarboxylase [Niabella beijingensis]